MAMPNDVTSSNSLDKVLREVQEVENRESGEPAEKDLKFRPGFVHLLMERFDDLRLAPDSTDAPAPEFGRGLSKSRSKSSDCLSSVAATAPSSSSTSYNTQRIIPTRSAGDPVKPASHLDHLVPRNYEKLNIVSGATPVVFHRSATPSSSSTVDYTRKSATLDRPKSKSSAPRPPSTVIIIPKSAPAPTPAPTPAPAPTPPPPAQMNGHVDETDSSEIRLRNNVHVKLRKPSEDMGEEADMPVKDIVRTRRFMFEKDGSPSPKKRAAPAPPAPGQHLVLPRRSSASDVLSAGAPKLPNGQSAPAPAHAPVYRAPAPSSTAVNVRPGVKRTANTPAPAPAPASAPSRVISKPAPVSAPAPAASRVISKPAPAPAVSRVAPSAVRVAPARVAPSPASGAAAASSTSSRVHQNGVAPAKPPPGAGAASPGEWKSWDDIPKPVRKGPLHEAKRVEVTDEDSVKIRKAGKSWFFGKNAAEVEEQGAKFVKLQDQTPRSAETVRSGARSGGSKTEERLAQETFWDAYRSTDASEVVSRDSELAEEARRLMRDAGASGAESFDLEMDQVEQVEVVTQPIPSTNIDDLYGGSASGPTVVHTHGRPVLKSSVKRSRKDKMRLTFADDLHSTFEYISELALIQELGITPDYSMEPFDPFTSSDEPERVPSMDNGVLSTPSALRPSAGAGASGGTGLAAYQATHVSTEFSWGSSTTGTRSAAPQTVQIMDVTDSSTTDSTATSVVGDDPDFTWSTSATADLLF